MVSMESKEIGFYLFVKIPDKRHFITMILYYNHNVRLCLLSLSHVETVWQLSGMFCFTKKSFQIRV